MTILIRMNRKIRLFKVMAFVFKEFKAVKANILPYFAISCGGLVIAETRILSLTLAEALLRKGCRRFLQGVIETDSHLFTDRNTPYKKWGVECLCGKASRSRPFSLPRKLN